MLLTQKDVAAQVRAVLFPILRERGFSSVRQTVSHAYPNPEVIHQFQLGQFSDYHRRVMAFPRYTFYAQLITYFPFTFDEKTPARKVDTKTGKIRMSTRRIVSHKYLALDHRLMNTLDREDGTGDESVWRMHEQTVEYCARVVENVAHQLRHYFDTYHQQFEDLDGILTNLLDDQYDHRSIVAPAPYYTGQTPETFLDASDEYVQRRRAALIEILQSRSN